MSRLTVALIGTLCSAVLSSCHSSRDQDAAERSSPAASGVSSSQVALAVRPSSVSDSTRSSFVVHGVCPFECCQYGQWRLATAVTLRARPEQGADSVGTVVAGRRVRADSGVVVLSPVGLAVVMGPSVRRTYDDSTPFSVGDTIEVLNYEGEGFSKVRWHGQELSVRTASWDSIGSNGVRLIRPPVSSWWVHMTDSATVARGWVLMTNVRADGADACS